MYDVADGKNVRGLSCAPTSFHATCLSVSLSLLYCCLSISPCCYAQCSGVPWGPRLPWTWCDSASPFSCNVLHYRPLMKDMLSSTLPSFFLSLPFMSVTHRLYALQWAISRWCDWLIGLEVGSKQDRQFYRLILAPGQRCGGDLSENISYHPRRASGL